MSIKKLYKVTKIVPLSNSEWQIRWGLLRFSGSFSNSKKDLARLPFHFSSTRLISHKSQVATDQRQLGIASNKFTQQTKAASSPSRRGSQLGLAMELLDKHYKKAIESAYFTKLTDKKKLGYDTNYSLASYWFAIQSTKE